MKIERQLKRLLACCTPCLELRVIFKPICKLSMLTKLKSVIPIMQRSNIVYRVNCLDCHDFYVGLTQRRLSTRMLEHDKLASSSIRRHALDTGHRLGTSTPQVLCSDNISARLFIKESLYIAETRALVSLNKNIGCADLKLW